MPEESLLKRSPRARRWRVAGWSLVALLLLLPAIAMQFTSEVNWTMGDFVFAGVLLGGTGLVMELVFRLSPDRCYRAGVVVAALTALLLVWINGAVGIIGNADNPANLLYFAVLVAAVAGSIAAGFRAGGMARAMLVAAALQAVIMVAAPLFSWGPPGEAAVRTFCLNGVFVVFWMIAWVLFRNVNTGRASA